MSGMETPGEMATLPPPTEAVEAAAAERNLDAPAAAAAAAGIPSALSPSTSPSSAVPASSPSSAPSVARAAPVVATAPTLRPPTAAPIAGRDAAGGSLFGSLASKLTSKVEKHAPGLVASFKEHVAAATQKEEQQRMEKQQQTEKLKALASAPAAAQPTVASPISVSSPPAAAGSNIATIPGLGPVALADPSHPADSEKAAKQAQVWANLNSEKKETPSPQSAAAPTVTAATVAPNSKSPSKDNSPSTASSSSSSSSTSPPSQSAMYLSPPVVVGDNGSGSPAEIRRRRGGGNGEEEKGRGGDSASSSRRGSASSSSNRLLPEISLSASTPSPSSSSLSSSSSSSSSSLKLDLPLRLCLVILKKSASEMREKYAEYMRTKVARHEGDAPLSFPQFMFFSTIRTLPDFLFKKTELAFCMMRNEGDTLVFEENFVRYAPILTPLASRIDAKRLYQALQGASIQAEVALTEEQVLVEEMEWREAEEAAAAEREATSVPHPTVPPRPPRLQAGGIGYAQFKLYVDHLKKYVPPNSGENGWPEFRSSFPRLDKHEQLLVVRTGVTDSTTFPPHIGRMGLTTNYLLYESALFKRKRAIRWNHIVRIEKNEEGFWRKGSSHTEAATTSSTSTSSTTSTPSDTAKGLKLYILDDDDAAVASSDSLHDSGRSGHDAPALRKEVCLRLDLPGWGVEAALERARTFAYMRILMHVHKLVAATPDKVVAAALIQESCMSILRMRALEAVGPGAEPLLLNPFQPQQAPEPKPLSVDPASAAPSSASSPPSASLSGVVSPTSTSSFVSTIQSSIARAESIRKSKSSWLFAVLPGLQNKEKETLEEDIDPELSATEYKTAEELAMLSRSVHQPFSLKNFAYNVKLFRYQLEPLFLFFALVRRVRDWENPLLTLCTVLMLLNLAYRDYLQYLPALIVLLNLLCVAMLKYYPNALQVALGGQQQQEQEEEEEEEQKRQAEEARAHAATPLRHATLEEIEDGEELGESEDADGWTHAWQQEAAAQAAATADSHATPSRPVPQPTAQPVSSPPSTGPSSSSSSSSSTSRRKKDKLDDAGLLAKLKTYRDVAVRTKEYLHSVQNQVGEANVRIMKVEGLYKWRSPEITQKFFLVLLAAFILLVTVPFRFIFPFIVLDFFTTKWQREGTLERLLQAVALPSHMPDLD